MVANLVSIITPCYNTGKYLPTLLKSILFQDYPHIEMIAIDDGSIDNTAEVIKSYIPQFKDKGYSLTYLRQKNSGQSVAIQQGLIMANGEFLVWPDSDDYYASYKAISKMVKRFKTSAGDVAIVRTQEVVVEDSVNHTVKWIYGINAKELEEKSLFCDCLFDRNGFYYCSGAYMLKLQSFINSSKLPIFTSKDAGQNWQLLLPILYHYRCSTILEPLYHVVYRTESHSRGQYAGYSKSYKKYFAYYNTLIATLDNILNMPEAERCFYKNEIEKKYNRILLRCALYNCDKSKSIIHYNKLIKYKETMPLRIKIAMVLLKLGILPFILKLKGNSDY